MTKAGQSIVYVSCSKGDCIEVIALDSMPGELAHITTTALPGNGMPLALSPDKRHLYAAVSADVDGRAEPRYAAYRINPASGIPELLATIKAPGRMSHITVDRSGHYLLGASVANDLISSTAILGDGTLAAEPTENRTVPSKAHQITTDLTNQLAFVPNLGADLVMQLRFDAETGRFTENNPPAFLQPAGAAPRHIAHHPGGRYVYLLNEEDGSIAACKLDAAAGTLEEFQRSSFLPADFSGKPWGAQILITPDGRFLYTSERTSSTICLHTIEPVAGTITRSGVWPTEACPRNFAITPSGHHLIAAGEKSDRVACYAIDQTSGSLSETSTIATAAGPLWIEALELEH